MLSRARSSRPPPQSSCLIRHEFSPLTLRASLARMDRIKILADAVLNSSAFCMTRRKATFLLLRVKQMQSKAITPRGEREAFGHPGAVPHWATAAKSGVGCAVSGLSRLWFTLSKGIVTEVYHPSIDQAAIRDLGFLVADSHGFFSEEQVDCRINTKALAPGVPAYTIENQCVTGRYRIFKQIFADPTRDVLLQRVKFVPASGNLAELRLFVTISLRLADQGQGNSGWVGSYRNWPMLLGQRDDHALALASSASWLHRSAGFVGQSDAWQDIRRHGAMTWEFDRAENGNVALAGEIDLQACNGEFVLALSLDNSPDSAALNAFLSLGDSFDTLRDEYVQQWQAWQKQISPLDTDELTSTNNEQRERADRSRPRVAESDSPRPANLHRTSMMVLRVHRSKQLNGAAVASLATPWGEIRDDDDIGGYHLVWARDLVEEAMGLLAGGAGDLVLSTLNYLRATQKTDGGWPQDMWLDGSPYSDGVQLDEAGLPVLLVDLAHRESLLNDEQLKSFWPMVRSAAAFVIRSGPSTGQDRWENTPGLSPYTLAAEVTALLIAARLADRFGEPDMGEYFRETADLWNDQIEPWTYVTDTPLARRLGVEGYYVRISPSPGMHTLLGHGRPPLMKQARDLPVTDVVSCDALALVRCGLRAADDPRILNTVKVIDAMTRIELPAGPCWRRYNGGYYGETDDGLPFTGHADKSNRGRGWPLLTGERGHYELAAGHPERARKMLETMNGFASQAGFLPEQVWDSDDIPQRDLFRGRPSGSAMPLAWAHSEYLRLLRSIRDRRVFDRPDDAWERYVQRKVGSDLCLWRFDHQIDSCPAGRQLRIEVMAPAIVRFSIDGWKHYEEVATRGRGIGIHVVDLPIEDVRAGSTLCFTFRWPEAGHRWEGKDFSLHIEPPAQRQEPDIAPGRLRNRRRHTPVEING